MKLTAIWSLLALNLALLLLFLIRCTGESPAVAQVSRPGDYLMIPGQVLGGNNAVVYVLDQTSRSLSALVYDDSMKRITTMPPINLDRIINPDNRRQPR